MTKQNAKLLIAGGGTGGHVWAGVAVAEAWRSRFGQDAPICYVGAKGKIEEQIIPKTGLKLYLLNLGSLNRVTWARKISTVAQLPLALCKSLFILLRERPQVVLGVGGYSSGPVLLVAGLFSWLFRWKTGIVEQNTIAGLTNRILGRFVDKIFCAYGMPKSDLPRHKVEITGNPIRMQMEPLASAARRPFHLFVFGGSQGARGLNSLVLDALEHLDDLKEVLTWTHQTGRADFERVKAYHDRYRSRAEILEFIYDMKTVYAQSSLLICRAGSSTLSEIAAVNRASILVPLPTASDNHQYENAKVYVQAGASLMLEQDKATGAELAGLIRALVLDPQRIDRMERMVHGFYRPHAARDIVKQFEF